MFGAMRRFYYWPAMAVEIAEVLKGCHPCARNWLTKRRNGTSLRLFPPSVPNEHVAIDLLGPSPKTADGNIFVRVISDRFRKLSRTVALPDDKALTVLAAIMDNWVSAYGIPAKNLSDNGSNLTSKFVSSLLGLLGIEPTRSSDYHTQTNGQVQRFNRTLVKMPKYNVADHTNTWNRLLWMVTLAYNARPHRSTKIAPLEWVMPLGMGNLSFHPNRVRTKDKPEGRPAKRLHLEYLAKLLHVIPRLREALDRTQR